MAFHKISPVDPIDSEHVYSMVAFLENCMSVLFAFGNFLHANHHPISSHPAKILHPKAGTKYRGEFEDRPRLKDDFVDVYC